jgi:hypothetical protein
MGSTFLPQFGGYLPEDLPDDTLARVAEAVRGGTFQPGPSGRTQYVLVFEEADRIRFQARTFLTAIGIGLNDVTLERLRDGRIAYFVSFYRWFYYCLVITLVGLAVPAGMLIGRALGPSLGLRPAFGGGGPWVDAFLCAVMALGLCWPFVLTFLHKPVVRGFLEQLVRRACADGASPHVAGVPGAGGMGGHYEYVSSARLLGLPLVHIAFGPRHGKPRSVAKGVIAIGDVAFGVVLAVGGLAVGGVSLGGVSLGVLALGGCALGGVAVGGLAVGLVAVGGLAVGVVAVGGAAVGYYAVGGGAIGVHAAGGSSFGLR